jgi:hypothetical protein
MTDKEKAILGANLLNAKITMLIFGSKGSLSFSTDGGLTVRCVVREDAGQHVACFELERD